MSRRSSSSDRLKNPKDEAWLLARARRGDRRAFAALIEPYRERIYATAVRVLGNHDDATEVAQDAIVRTFWKITGFQGKARFYTWLYRIALNLCYRRLERRRYEPQLFQPVTENDDEASRPEELLPDPSASPHEQAASSETVGLVRQALTALPRGEFQILVLREFEELSYEEVARHLRVPKGTVMSRLHRARVALAKELRRLGAQG
ncbi:MAG: sigma-70 family RNA polymerase sigma factor [Candidatus Omnitrophica bacterium]|nr:sigma-70 family RNA polymerase sigma factor [Candidatus Omnitrophota bacterium]